MKYRTCMVQWVDSQCYFNGWNTPDSFLAWAEQPMVIINSVGFLTYECKEYIVISQSVHLEGDNLLTDHTKIPRFAIENMTFLQTLEIVFEP